LGLAVVTSAHVRARMAVSPRTKVRMRLNTSQVLGVKTPPERWAPGG